MGRRCEITIAALVAGCGGGTRPGQGVIEPVSGKAVLIGEPFTIITAWNNECRRKSCYKDGNHFYSDEYCHDVWSACQPQPYDVEVRCSGPAAAACPSDLRHVESGALDFDIQPAVPGILKVQVILYNPSVGTRVEDTVWDVRVPDRLAIKPTVQADEPRVAVRFSLGGTAHRTSLARVNGTPVPDGVADLATLFPDRRVGTSGAVEPGPYDLTVEAGAFHQTVSVEAVARGAAPAGPSPVDPY